MSAEEFPEPGKPLTPTLRPGHDLTEEQLLVAIREAKERRSKTRQAADLADGVARAAHNEFRKAAYDHEQLVETMRIKLLNTHEGSST